LRPLSEPTSFMFSPFEEGSKAAEERGGNPTALLNPRC